MHRLHGVATKCLHHYLGWRRLLDRFHDQLTLKQFLSYAIRDCYVDPARQHVTQYSPNFDLPLRVLQSSLIDIVQLVWGFMIS